MREIIYNRNKAVSYAHKWAYDRNSRYYNFDNLGGDCTNFISQCLFAGCGVMNYGGEMGWYYINLNNRSPSWSGVEFLYNFLVKNKSVGPYGVKTDIKNIQIGDVVQLKFSDNVFGHSQLVVSVGSPPDLNNILVATHTFNSDNRPISTYNFSNIRYIHILGARKY